MAISVEYHKIFSLLCILRPRWRVPLDLDTGAGSQKLEWWGCRAGLWLILVQKVQGSQRTASPQLIDIH